MAKDNLKIIATGQRRQVRYNGWDQVRVQDNGIAPTHAIGLPEVKEITLIDEAIDMGLVAHWPIGDTDPTTWNGTLGEIPDSLGHSDVTKDKWEKYDPAQTETWSLVPAIATGPGLCANAVQAHATDNPNNYVGGDLIEFGNSTTIDGYLPWSMLGFCSFNMVNGTYGGSTYQDLIRTGSAPGFALDPSGSAIQMYQNGGGFSRLVRDVGTFMFFRADSGDPVGGPYLGPYYVAAYVPDEDTLYWHQHGGAYQDPSGLWLGAKLYALKAPRFVSGYNDLAFPFESYTKYQDLMFFDRVLTQAEVLAFGRKAFGV